MRRDAGARPHDGLPAPGLRGDDDQEAATGHTRALIAAGRRSLVHPVWGGPGWKVFLDSPERIVEVIKYIEQNPVKAGRASQIWDFVTGYGVTRGKG